MDSQELQRIKNKFDIVGNDAEFNRAIEMAVAVAPTDLTVLVCGESGVGKENIPQIVHQFSRRRNGPYFSVNCGAIPEGTIESELFGHEKGSFTGAIEARKGYFEVADKGTLFLDEVGELPLPYQAKLLRVLQSGEFTRVGASKVSHTDVRVIAATNKDLRYAVAQGKFREDLYYRLNAIQITLPSLRDRKDDIYLLFRKFVSDFAEKYGMRKISLTHDAIELVRRYRWPGNIRQLKNIAETVQALESIDSETGEGRLEVDAMTLARYIPKDDPNNLPVAFKGSSDAISESDKQDIFKAIYTLSNEVRELKRIVGGFSAQDVGRPAIPSSVTPDISRPDEGTWDNVDIQDTPQEAPRKREDADGDESLSIKGASEDLIRKALERHGGNRKKAAEELGISERTLYRKLPPEYRIQKSNEHGK